MKYFVNPLRPETFSLELLSPWQKSALWIGICIIGILILATTLFTLLMWKSKKAQTIWFVGIGISVLIMLAWGLIFWTFEAVNVAGLRNGILALVAWLIMGILLWVIPIKAIMLVEKYQTMRKLSIWALIVAWFFTLLALSWFTVNFFLGADWN